jgi:hypothetical protein
MYEEMNNRVKKNILVFIFYLLISYFLFGRNLGTHFNTMYIGPYAHDQLQFIWSMQWLPYAITHHLNPIFPKVIWAPLGQNIAIAPGGVFGASLLALPITILFGPVVSYNVLIIVGNALSAFFTFQLIRYITKSDKAAIISALIFGFSTYQITQIIHLNLDLTFLIPLLVYLQVRLWNKDIGTKLFIFLFSICLVFQFLFSVELFATFSLLLVIGYILVFLIVYKKSQKIIRNAKLVGVGYIITGLLVSPFLYYAHQIQLPTIPVNPPSFWSIDLLNYGIPTIATLIGHTQFQQVSATFLPGIVESGAYIGVPLLILCIAYIAKFWKKPWTKILALGLFIIIIFSLGPILHIAGIATIQLPWKLFTKIKYISQALPVRFTVYAFLLTSIICGLWIASPRIKPLLKYTLVILSLLFLIPNLGIGGIQATNTNTPSFFTKGTYKRYISRGENVLILPFAGEGDGMLWQAQTDMYFSMPEGYLTPWPLSPSVFVTNPGIKMLNKNMDIPPTTQNDYPLFIEVIKQFHIQAILISPKEYNYFAPILNPLHVKPKHIGELLYYNFK